MLMKVAPSALRLAPLQVGAPDSQRACGTVLGRFLHSLNKFAHEEYGLEFDICDYDVYEFAKVRASPLSSCPAVLTCSTS